VNFRRVLTPIAAGVLGAAVYRLLVRGALTIDAGIGRRTQPLGRITKDIAAPLRPSSTS